MGEGSGLRAGAILGLGAFSQGGLADRAEHLGDVFLIHQGFLLDFKQIRFSFGCVAIVTGATILGDHLDFLLYCKRSIHLRIEFSSVLLAKDGETVN
jgi:hypothetical protein